jgi:hypothetical protein
METGRLCCGYFVLATLFDLALLNLKVSPSGRNDKQGSYDTLKQNVTTIIAPSYRKACHPMFAKGRFRIIL